MAVNGELKEQVVGFVLQRLHSSFGKAPVPVDEIDTELGQWRNFPMYANFEADDWDHVAKIIKSRVKITMGDGDQITAKNFKPWVKEKHDSITWKRWVSYKQMLTAKGFTPGVLSGLDVSTDEILDCIGDPRADGAWKRRGLVIGDVQSGKTATYLGAINKAADAGYTLIVLLAGGTEALRKQTQFRVDEGLIGRDSSKSPAGQDVVQNPVFGVGAWHAQFVSAQGLTTQQSDFRKTSKRATNIVLDLNSPTPLIFVLKKNKTALENLRDWLKEQRDSQAQLAIPMLLVDDESDYASVNTKDENSDPTVINMLIRDILLQTSKSSYLAFTATPFANVFIGHESEDEVLGDDLFPNDYIRTLDPPNNYRGSRFYFGSEEDADDSRLMILDDAADQFPLKHKAQQIVTEIPDSLQEAIRTFVVASAIREARGDSSPRSMLVNVSRFKNVQFQLHELVEGEFERIKNAVELHAASLTPGNEHAEMAALRSTFEARYPTVELTWPRVLGKLKAAVHDTTVKLINSDRVTRAEDMGELESDRMIAVGGDVLSRGLTLDGLTVSYFHRAVGASDTLLQMARWFGYRPGYDDLCRVWIPDEVADQFRYVAGIVDELRGQLSAMKKQALTPQDFGLSVRMHPEALLITARNKMRAAEAKAWTIDIAGKRGLETAKISSAGEDQVENLRVAENLARSVEAAGLPNVWKLKNVGFPATTSVDKSIVAAFLSDYVAFPADPLFADSTLAAFIEKTTTPKLQKWTVGFVTGQGADWKVSPDLFLSGTVQRTVKAGTPVKVSLYKDDAVAFRVSGKSSRLAGSTDMGKAAARLGKPLTEPDVFEVLSAPVLLVYVLSPLVERDAAAADLWERAQSGGAKFLIGVKVGIPGKPGEKGTDVQYMLNSVALQSWRGANIEDTDDDDMGQLDGVDNE